MTHHIIYDQADPDGFMSMIIAAGFLKNKQVETYPWHYGKKKIDFDYDPSKDAIYILDMSLAPEEMMHLAVTLKGRLIWIDHHPIVNELRDSMKEASCYLDTGWSTMELAWEYFYPGEDQPEVIKYLGAYDCREYGLNRPKPTEEFWKDIILPLQICFQTYMGDYLFYSTAIVETNLGKYVSIGRYMLAFEKSQFEWVARHTCSGTFHGQGVAAVNAMVNPSRLKDYLDVHTLLTYYHVGYDEHGRAIWKYSLRSDFPVNNIARSYGGGGHPRACGFTYHLPLDQMSEFRVYEED